MLDGVPNKDMNTTYAKLFLRPKERNKEVQLGMHFTHSNDVDRVNDTLRYQG